MVLNSQHVIVSNGERKADIYRDNIKSWNVIGSGMSVDVVSQSDMAATVIKSLENM